MSRLRKAGGADYQGRLNAVGSYLLDEINEGKTNFKGYREIDEVFPEQVTTDNADVVINNLGARSPIIINDDGVAVGGDLLTDKKGRINLDQIPFDERQLAHTAPDSVNTDLYKRMQAMLFPEMMTEVPNELRRAHDIGAAMQANDPKAYQRAGSPIVVDDDAAAYITSMLTKGKNNTPLASSSFVNAGGLGTESRSQILMHDTGERFVDADKATQKSYKEQRAKDFVKQWLSQGGASIGNPSAVIVAPGKNSHMDHVQALSSSIDTIGDKGWGYSDAPSNYSYLDAEANVHSKLNYTLQGQHLMMRLADQMRKAGQPFPARLSQSELGDPNRRRLTDEEGAIRLATDKATNTVDAGERLLDIIQYLNKYGN